MEPLKILVVYDSVFGNTERVAKAISESLGCHEDEGLARVTDVTPGQLMGLDLLVVGSPTRAFNPTGDTKGFLKKIPARGLIGVRVAAFDTRMSPADVQSRVYSILERRFGYAAEPIGKGLTKKGGKLVIQPEGFLVEGSEGPLKMGELDRARAWARSILSVV